MDSPSEQSVMDSTSNNNVNIMDSPLNDYVNVETTSKKKRMSHSTWTPPTSPCTMKYFPSTLTPPTSPTTPTTSDNFRKVAA